VCRHVLVLYIQLPNCVTKSHHFYRVKLLYSSRTNSFSVHNTGTDVKIIKAVVMVLSEPVLKNHKNSLREWKEMFRDTTNNNML
jgi:hypothetical protein